MGALLALGYATKYPGSVRRLLLMNAPLFKDAQEARNELAGTNLFFRLSLYWELHRLVCPLMRISAMKLLMRQVMPKKYRGMETYIFSSSAEARSRSLKNVIEDQHGIFDLSQLTLPITVIQGSNERPKYIENLLKITTKPNLKILFADTGHHTMVDNPRIAIRALRTQQT
jgi:pimeloyl-ACP methyl ester carboxylesterase